MFFIAMARATSSISMPASWGVGSSLGGCFPPLPPCRARPILWPSQRRPRYGRARSGSSCPQLLELSLRGTIPYRTDWGQSLIAGLAKGAYPQAAWARSQWGLPPSTRDFSFARFRETRVPRPQDKPPVTHGVQLVSPSRPSGCLSVETASASFGDKMIP